VRLERRAPAPRPSVQRVARPAPAPEPVPPPRPGLFRRIVDGFRRPEPEPAPAPQPARAKITRLVAGTSVDDADSGPADSSDATVARVPVEPPPDESVTPTRSVSAPQPLVARTRSQTGAPAEPRPRMELHDTAPPPPVSETPAIRGTSAERLARAVGAEATVDESGNASVELPAPGEPFVPFSTAPRTVTRAALAEPAPAPEAAPALAGAPGAPPVDVDELAETVMERLRRELLIEREQSGGGMDLI
jgi:hypothetical protein